MVTSNPLTMNTYKQLEGGKGAIKYTKLTEFPRSRGNYMLFYFLVGGKEGGGGLRGFSFV